MKKIYLLAIFTILTILPFLSAIQINMNSNFSQGETLTAEIFGNFINPLQAQNILLYQGHIRVSFIPSIMSNNGIYYIYGQLSGKPAGNYSLVLSNVNYFESGKSQTGDISKNFTISNQNADFSITPGFVSAGSEKTFYITAQNLGGNLILVNSSLSATPSGNAIAGTENSTQIIPGISKKIYFSIKNVNSSPVYASISDSNTSYNIPVFVSSSSFEQQPTTSNTTPASPPATFVHSFEVQPYNINISLPTNSSTTRYIYVNNTADNAENISANVSETLNQYIYLVNNTLLVPPNSTRNFELRIVSKNNSSLASGSVNFYSGNVTRQVNLVLNISESYVPVEASGSSGSSSQSLFQTCSQLGGILCNGTSTCSGQVQSAQDGSCCLGACQAQQQGSNAGKIIGWIFVGVIVILLVIFFVKRYSKARRHPINLPGFLKKKELR